jgi:hypothetical protein
LTIRLSAAGGHIDVGEIGLDVINAGAARD